MNRDSAQRMFDITPRSDAMRSHVRAAALRLARAVPKAGVGLRDELRRTADRRPLTARGLHELADEVGVVLRERRAPDHA